ncbi:MAG: hypothetical protein JOZ96_05910 [Acidobacteria bacterium]|nr:hypothetical protein [Acidobacteriota bacterium]
MKHSAPKLLRRLAPLLCLALFAAAAGAQTLFCPKHHIDSFENVSLSAEADIAKQYTQSDVSEFSDMRVYVTSKEGVLYIQTNYRPADNEYPLKLATKDAGFGLSFYIKNMLEQFELPTRGFDRAYSKDMAVFVDQGLLSSSRYRGLRFDDAGKVNIIDASGVARPTMRVPTAGGQTQLVMEFSPSLYARVTEADPGGFSSRYKSLGFRREDVRLLSLSTDSMTKALISEKIPAANRVEFDLSSPAALEASLSAHGGTTVFALGHIEGSSFVTRDAGGKVAFTIPIAELESMAKKHNVTVFAFGCNSASATEGARGTLTAFNTVDAVGRFEQALSADNYLTFFDKLAGPEIFMLLDDSVLGAARERQALTVYARETEGAGGRARVAPVGRVLILNPGAYVAASQGRPPSTPTPLPNVPAARDNRTVAGGGGGDSGSEDSGSEDSGSGMLIFAGGGLLALAGITGVVMYRRSR